MALRAFQSNPSIGGFGNESGAQSLLRASPADKGSGKKEKKKGTAPADQKSAAEIDCGCGYDKLEEQTSCDAFAQIVKELVDNAVDACGKNIHRRFEHQGESSKNPRRKATKTEEAPPAKQDSMSRRVRVCIERNTNEDPEMMQEEDGGAYQRQPHHEETAGVTFVSRESVLARHTETLRVTVADNGCGMERIENCVAAFRTSKSSCTSSNRDWNRRGHCGSRQKVQQAASSQTAELSGLDNAPLPGAREKNDSCLQEDKTAGRYGIGLTLCLLHAQRLVPNSCASITSATPTAVHWTRASFIVDASADIVRCASKTFLPKRRPNESGTAVSILVPGGLKAQRAWPRLAEYFARFQLNHSLRCSLEIFAPTLSRIPLYIVPSSEEEQHCRDVAAVRAQELDTAEKNEYEKANDEDMDASLFMQKTRTVPKRRLSKSAGAPDVNRRLIIQRAVSAYLREPVSLQNVAHSTQPIRRNDRTKCDTNEGNKRTTGARHCGTMEIDCIVYGGVGCETYDELSDRVVGSDNGPFSDVGRSEFETVDESSKMKAKLMIVRMVNGVPLLDSAEATSCGLVRGIVGTAAWKSFGLDVTPMEGSSEEGSCGQSAQDHAIEQLAFQYIPTFTVGDNSRMAQFLGKSNHDRFESSDTSLISLLPAGLRLGNVLVIANITASPSELPLPTLSKGRLPLNDTSIDHALINGITCCLRSLRITNPNLLLSTNQLKETERDIRYIPAVAAALSSIVCASKERNCLIQRISSCTRQSENCTEGPASSVKDQPSRNQFTLTPDSNDSEHVGQTHSGTVSSTPSISDEELASLFEQELRLATARQSTVKAKKGLPPKSSRRRRAETVKENQEEIHAPKPKAACSSQSSKKPRTVNLENLLFDL